MIITQEKSKEVINSHNFDQVRCTIDAEDMRYVASLLRNNYSNTRLAVIREISANALDANAEAGVSRSIEIKMPTSLNPTFAVILKSLARKSYIDPEDYLEELIMTQYHRSGGKVKVISSCLDSCLN